MIVRVGEVCTVLPANELEAALGQYFSATRGSEFLDGQALTAGMVQQWVEGLEEED
jgi:hypothetical protein